MTQKTKPGKRKRANIAVEFVTDNRECYSRMRKKYRGFSNYGPDVYKQIIRELNNYYIQYPIDTGNIVILPNGLGKLGICKFRKVLKIDAEGRPNRMIDMCHLKKTGEIKYHLNEHTEGYSFKWWWGKKGCRLPYPALWKLKWNRDIRSRLAKTLLAEGCDWKKYHSMTDATREILIRRRINRENERRNNAE